MRIATHFTRSPSKFLLERIARLERSGNSIAALDVLRNAHGRTRAMLAISLDQLEEGHRAAVAMLNGWGGYLLTAADDANAFFSHDEFIDFYARQEASLAEAEKMIGGKRP